MIATTCDGAHIKYARLIWEIPVESTPERVSPCLSIGAIVTGRAFISRFVL